MLCQVLPVAITDMIKWSLVDGVFTFFNGEGEPIVRTTDKVSAWAIIRELDKEKENAREV